MLALEVYGLAASLDQQIGEKGTNPAKARIGVGAQTTSSNLTAMSFCTSTLQE